MTGPTKTEPAAARGRSGQLRVGVVIPFYNGAAFLDEALASVSAQTRPADQVIVVDDGSSEDPAPIVDRHAGVTLLCQANAGPSAARNAGLQACDCDFVVFLDCDDVLSSTAIERGVRCHLENPGSGFVYGAHRRVDASGKALGPATFRPCGPIPYHDFLRTNVVGCMSPAMFDRAKLVAAGGFADDVRACEDYEVYLRMARQHPVASQPAIVADYRIHAGSTAPNAAGLFDWALKVLDRHRLVDSDVEAMAAFRDGRRRWALIYANAAWSRAAAPGAKRAMASRAPLASTVAMAAAVLRRALPARLYRKLRGRAKPLALGRGAVDMGDFARNRPVGRNFGLDRGTPIDRWYIERFLARHAGDISGRVLEVGDPSYSRRFGSGITRQDVFDRPGGPVATLTGDLTAPGTLPEAAFDCLVITQVLQLLYDMPAAIAEMHRSLAPGGVLLLTVPGVTAIDPAEWDGAWYWSLTAQSAERLLGAAFGPDSLRISVHGNAYGATCFLQGLAVEEIDTALLEDDDPAYPMVVCVRAQRAR